MTACGSGSSSSKNSSDSEIVQDNDKEGDSDNSSDDKKTSSDEKSSSSKDSSEKLDNGEYEDENFIYQVYDHDKIMIKEYIGSSDEVVIPDEIGGVEVVKIDHCYKEAPIKKIVISDNVVKIDEAAFKNCTTLEEIQMSKNLEEVGKYAFEGCTSLKEVEFYDKLEYIWGNAFLGCENLEKVTFAENGALEHILGDAFRDCTSLKEINFPDTLKDIGRGVLTNSGIYNNAPEGELIYVGTALVGNRQEEMDVAVKEDTTLIFPEIFSCKDKRSYEMDVLEIPKSVTYIGEDAFAYLTIGTLKIESTELKAEKPFDGSKIGTIEFAEGLTEIPYTLLSYIDIEEIEIPGSVEVLGQSAFKGSSVKKIVVDEGVKEMKRECIEFCDSLEELYLPESLETIGDDAILIENNVLKSTNDKLVIYVKKGSVAEEYVKENNLKYENY